LDYYAGNDATLEHSSVCILNFSRQIIRGAKVADLPLKFLSKWSWSPAYTANALDRFGD